MKHRSPKLLLNLILVLVVLGFSLFSTIPAFADDATPPAPTEEPVQPPTEAPPLTAEPVTGSTEEAVSLPEVLEQLPEDTQVVVMNETGEVQPLVTQDAAQAVATADPLWCPEGVTPQDGAGGCSPSHSTFTGLLTWLNTNDPNQSGVIWIEKTYDSSSEGVAGFVLDGASLPNFSTHNLTIQGGWNGLGTATVDSSSPSSFNGDSLAIQNWQGNVTINDLLIQNAGDTGLYVSTGPGNVSLNNITSMNNSGNGIYVDALGNVSVNTLTANNNTDSGITIYSTGAVTGNDITANENGGGNNEAENYGLHIDNQSGSGDVTLGGTNLFRSNLYSGVRIDSNGNVSLSGVTSEAHVDDFGADIGTLGNVTITCSAFNNNWSGVGLFTDQTVTEKSVTFSGNTFTDNMLFGNPTLIEVADYDCNPVIPPSPATPTTPAQPGNDDPGRPLYIVPVTGTFDCTSYSGTLLVLPDGDRALFPCPLEGQGKLDVVTDQSLPGPAPDGTEFSSSFTVHLVKNGEEQQEANPSITVSFMMPEGAIPQNLAILFWNGTAWVEVDGAYVSSDEHFEAHVNSLGTYMLVTK